MGFHSHKIKLTHSFYIRFQIRKKALYGGNSIQRKRTRGGKIQSYSFENLICEPKNK